MSRVSGMGRGAVIAAVLGPTFLGNVFQAVNLIPTFIFLVLTGSLFTELLVPPLLRLSDQGRRDQVERLAGAFLGLSVAVLSVVAVLLVAVGPFVVRMLAATVGNDAAAASQRDVGWTLLVMVAPQVVLYAFAGVGAAVMNAHGRFALAAGAPALENAALIAVLLVTAGVFGTGIGVGSVSDGQLALLGLGSTGAVALHAGAQWWGAWRAGVRIRPNLQWRAPEVVDVVRRARASAGHATLECAPYLFSLVVANRVAGGVVAFQLAVQFLYFPIALGVRPIAISLLPRLSRLAAQRADESFRQHVVEGTVLSTFLTLPAATAYVVLGAPLAAAFAVGAMDDPRGTELLAAALAAIGPAVVGEATFVIGTQACYARDDARSPLVAMAVRTTVTMAGMLVALMVEPGAAVLVVLGLSVSAGNLAGALHLAHRLRRWLPPAELGRPLLRNAAASAAMVVPAFLVAHVLAGRIDHEWGDTTRALAATIVGVLTFAVVQRLWRSPELELLTRRRATPRNPV